MERQDPNRDCGPVTVWHDTDQRLSQQVMQVLLQLKVETDGIPIREEPPVAGEIRAMLSQLGLPARAILRTEVAACEQLGLAEQQDDDVLIRAMSEHAELIVCPIVVVGDTALLVTDPQQVRDLLQAPAPEPAAAAEMPNPEPQPPQPVSAPVAPPPVAQADTPPSSPWVPQPDAAAAEATPAVAAVSPVPTPVPIVEQRPQPEPAAVDPEPLPAPPPRPPRAGRQQLLWFDTDEVARIRRHPEWTPILQALQLDPPEDELEQAVAGQTPADAEERREVFEVLSRAKPLELELLREQLDASFRQGMFVPQMVLVQGELEVGFDPLEVLKATATAAAPFAPGDEELEAVLKSVSGFLEDPHLGPTATVPETLTKRVRESFGRVGRPVPPDYLNEQVDHAILSERYYQRREVFGDIYLRGTLFATRSSSAQKSVPTYVPDELTSELPMFRRFHTRIIAELNMSQDQFDSHPACLRVVALARHWS